MLCARERKRTYRVSSPTVRDLMFSNHADDLVGHSSPRHAVTDGILMAEKVLSKGAVDDADPGGVRRIVVEVPTRQARDPHGFEISRCCHIQLHAWIWIIGLRCFRVETIAAISPGQRSAVGSGNRKYSWNGCDPLA